MVPMKIRSLKEALRLLGEAHDNELKGGRFPMHSRLKLKGHLHDAKRELRNEAKGTLYRIGKKTAQASKQFAKNASNYAHDRPWALMGVAAMFSVVFGFLLGRKSKD